MRGVLIWLFPNLARILRPEEKREPNKSIIAMSCCVADPISERSLSGSSRDESSMTYYTKYVHPTYIIPTSLLWSDCGKANRKTEYLLQ